jgi:phage regulator Rha-like protein
MKNELTVIKNNKIYTSSEIIANYIEREHRSVFSQIKKHKEDLKLFGVLTFEMRMPSMGKGGRPFEFTYLNEPQFNYLLMNLRTKEDEKDKVRKLKIKLTREFERNKELLLTLSVNKANQIWLDERENIKQIRKSTTDTIKRFVEYAKEQGSSNADRYYCNITKMENKALFIIETKYKNIRDILNLKQLSELKQADEIIEKALDDGMNEKMHYKDIFKLAKKRVTMFSELKGKSIIPELMQIGVNND